MIMLTKYDDSKILVHLDSIKCIEASSDTRVFFMNGDMIMVKETLLEIQKKSIEFRRAIQNPEKPILNRSQAPAQLPLSN